MIKIWCFYESYKQQPRISNALIKITNENFHVSVLLFRLGLLLLPTAQNRGVSWVFFQFSFITAGVIYLFTIGWP